MKKGKGKIKETQKSRQKKTRGSSSNKKHLSEPNPWKEIRLKLKPLSKAYDVFKAKRRIAKQKEERKKLKELEEQKHKDQEKERLKEQEEKRLRKEKKLKEQEEKKNKRRKRKKIKRKKN